MAFTVEYEIKDTDDWFKCFPPRGKDAQWKEGYSAFEFAKAVLDKKGFEKSIRDVLKDSKIKLVDKKIYPERGTSFDSISGGVRVHDLACVATDKNGEKIALCFEAKVRETFGELIKKEKQDSDGKKQRIKNLCTTFLGKEYVAEKASEIYYQLLTGLAGTIAFAREENIKNCYFIVYQLYPENEENMKEIQEHIDAVNNFLKLFNVDGRKLSCTDINNENPLNLGEITIYEEGKDKTKGTANVHIAFIKKSYKFEEEK